VETIREQKEVMTATATAHFFVARTEKAAVLAQVLYGTRGETRYLIQGIRPRNGIKRWMLDASAAAGIETIRAESNRP
jgi:hypothetical protein